jgi:hypothetical protein
MPAEREMGKRPSENKYGRSRGKGCYASRRSTPDRQPAKIRKVSTVIDNRRKNRRARSSQQKDRGSPSFSTILSHFSALPAEDRLQFLSWLFEGVLSRCLPLSDAGAIPSCRPSSEGGEMASPSREGGHATAESSLSRRGLDWSAEEDRLLVQIKEEEQLAWSEVIKHFNQAFPGRSPGSTKVHWYTKLNKRTS